MTCLPARASVYAVVRPAMPAPTMHTSHSASAASGGNEGTSAVAIHADTVVPESVFGSVMVEREGCSRSTLQLEGRYPDHRSVAVASASVSVAASSSWTAFPPLLRTHAPARETMSG